MSGLALALLALLSGSPLTEEDVVRMFVAGTAASRIVEEIEQREVRFDLSSEMLDELRRTGLPDAILQAMIERQAELTPPPPAPPAAADPAASSEPTLRIRLNPDREPGEPNRLRLADPLSAELRRSWQLDAALEGTSFEDLAVFLVCRSATHVPDHWRNASILGRDFISMPRHELLAFVAGASRLERKDDPGVLELELPDTLSVPLSAGVPHRLSLGIALKVGGRYYRLTDDAWDEVTVEGPGQDVEAAVKGNKQGQLAALTVRFDKGP